MNTLQNRYITQIIYCTSVNVDVLRVGVEGKTIRLKLIHVENDKYVYYANWLYKK